jgi:exonuclease SbcD
MSISFIHCGDLHLGFNQYNEEERFHDFGRAFAHIVDDAVAKQVKYFLIAGDLFNKRSINSRTLVQAMDELEKLKSAGIPVIAIEGNHDKAPYGDQDSWMWFLNEQGYIHLLTPFFDEKGGLVVKPWDPKTRTGTLMEMDGIRFIGLGYQGSVSALRLRELSAVLESSDAFTVLLFHSAVDRLMHLGGVRLEHLQPLRDRVNYVAMGHIHGRYEVDHWVYNPGCPECWDIKECESEKGYYHVTVPDARIEYIPSRRRPVFQFKVDISGMDDLHEIEEKIIQRVAPELEQKDRSMVRILLHGSLPIHPLTIDSRELEAKLKGLFYCLIVEIQNDAVLQSEELMTLADPNEIHRDQLETEVLLQLFSEQPEARAFTEELVSLTRQVKEQVLQQGNLEELAVAIEQLAAQSLTDEEIKGSAKAETEAAAAREEGASA